jgi:hypothetical protein
MRVTKNFKVHRAGIGRVSPQSNLVTLPGLPDGLFSNQKSKFG